MNREDCWLPQPVMISYKEGLYRVHENYCFDKEGNVKEEYDVVEHIFCTDTDELDNYLQNLSSSYQWEIVFDQISFSIYRNWLVEKTREGALQNQYEANQ